MAETVEGRIRRLAEEAAAQRIRAEFVCCNIYGRVNDTGELTFREARHSEEWHDLCYWGEASARLAENSTTRDVPKRPFSSSRPPGQLAESARLLGLRWSTGLSQGRHRRD